MKNGGFVRTVPGVDDDKIIDLQTRIAHQEHTIAELNDVVTGQQTELAMLVAQVRALTDRVRALSEAVPASDSGDETPPHY